MIRGLLNERQATYETDWIGYYPDKNIVILYGVITTSEPLIIPDEDGVTVELKGITKIVNGQPRGNVLSGGCGFTIHKGEDKGAIGITLDRIATFSHNKKEGILTISKW